MIAIRNLSMRLVSGGREVSILDDVSLDVPAKQFLAIIGPSGSGKSTLLGLIGGMDTPTSGTISIDGRDITKLSDDELSRLRLQGIGFVFQSFHLIPTLTARENIAVPIELAGDPEADAKVGELLRAVGLESRGHHYPVQLSGGEQQRVAVARASAPPAPPGGPRPAGWAGPGAGGSDRRAGQHRVRVSPPGHPGDERAHGRPPDTRCCGSSDAIRPSRSRTIRSASRVGCPP